jgi:hypothetical protein
MFKPKLGIVLAAAFAALLLVPLAANANPQSTATAQSTATEMPSTSLTHIPVSGTAHHGKRFNGHFNVTRFVTRGGEP